MEKNQDLDLSELQELALSHKVVKGRKTLKEKQMIVKSHLSDHVPISQLSRKFGVDKVTVYRWIRTFADGKVSERKSRTVPEVKQKPFPMPKKLKPEENATEELAGIRPASVHVRQATA